MNELIKNLTNNSIEETQELVEDLIYIIEKNSITSIEELKKLEDENFTIKGQILSREDKVNYCYNNIINSYYDADSLEYNELRTYNKYYKTLKNTSSIEEKIKYISLLYTMTGREHLLVYELYKYLTNDV